MNYLFDKKWFNCYQKKLLWLLNSPLTKKWFRWVLRIRQYDCPLNKKIIGLLPNSFIIEPFWKRKKCIKTPKGLVFFNKSIRLHRRLVKKYGYKMPFLLFFTQDFRTHNKYSKRLFYAFYPLWYLFHCWDVAVNFLRLPKLNLGFDTLTVYPEAGSAGTTADGSVARIKGVPGDTWADIHDGAGTGAYMPGGDDIVAGMSRGSDANWYQLIRGGFTFDTSALGASAIISAATASFNTQSKVDTLGSTPTFNLVSFAPTSNNDFEASSYATFGTTLYASAIAYADFVAAGSYNNMALNAAGLAAISLTGITRLGTRLGHDIDNTEGPAGTSKDSYFDTYMADYTGTTRDPKLVITYTVPLTINVNDLITVSESITADIDLNPNIFDSITITESITADIGFEINISDAVAVSEAITAENLELGGINISDAIAVSEAITAENLELGGIEISDLITITESVSVEFPIDISISDSIIVSESITIENTELGGINISDAIAVSEAITIENLELGGINISDTVTLSEDIAAMIDLNPSVLDAIAVSEDIAAQIDLGNISVNDVITLTESINMLLVAARRGLIAMRSTQQSYPIPMKSTQQSYPIPMDDNRTL